MAPEVSLASVTMLLDKGADVNAQGGHYGNALQASSSGSHDEVVTILLDKGANVKTQGGLYGNALQAASYGGHDKVVRLLLNHHALVNQKDIQGRTPFHLASAGGRMKVVEILSSFGSDPTAIDTQGRNCLHRAASKASIEIVKWLLKEGFDPNYADRDGWTSLHWAAKNGSASTIEVLKAAGARSTIEAIEGWTTDSVSIFHHNNPSSISRENANSELAAKRSNSSSAGVVELTDDERKISPGIWQNGCYCDGCLLVSFDLNNLLISLSDINRTYTVRVTSVRIAQILNTVSNAKVRQIRPILVTDLRNWNERGSHVSAFCESLGQEGLGRRRAARKYSKTFILLTDSTGPVFPH